MFGDKREKARDKIVAGLQPIVAFSAMARGRLPYGYWEDPFVLGFMQGCAEKLSEKPMRGLKAQTRGETKTAAFDILSEGQGVAILLRTRAFMDARHPDFSTALGNGAVCVMYAAGSDDFNTQPVIARAQKVGSNYTTVLGVSNPKDPKRISTAGALVHILFHEVVAQRLGP